MRTRGGFGDAGVECGPYGWVGSSELGVRVLRGWLRVGVGLLWSGAHVLLRSWLLIGRIDRGSMSLRLIGP